MVGPESRREAADHRAGLRWLGLFVLPVPIGLTLWRIGVLGQGSTDLLWHFLLDLLVSTYLVTLLSGPLRRRPPLPMVSGAVLAILALYVGWLYLPSGVGSAASLAAVTLAFGFALRWLREHFLLATFTRSGWMYRWGLADASAPADAVYTEDGLTGGPERTWRRYVAGPIIAGLLLSFVVIRVARPLDKRAEAQAVLETNDSFEIGRAFLKAATNGNAALFARERAIWFVEPDARGEVLSQAAVLFAQTKRALNESNLQWVDLGSLQSVESRIGRHPGATGGSHVHTYAGPVVAYLEDPQDPPKGLVWVDASRPYRGFYAWMAPLEVKLERTPGGVLVVGLSGAVEIQLHEPGYTGGR